MEKSASAESESDLIIVLIDAAGNYYELTRETLERSRVRGEDKEIKIAAIDEKIRNVLVATGYIGTGHIPGGVVRAFSIAPDGLRYVGYYLGSTETSSSSTSERGGKSDR